MKRRTKFKSGDVRLRLFNKLNAKHSIWHTLSSQLRMMICSFLGYEDLKRCNEVCARFCPNVKSMLRIAYLAEKECGTDYFDYLPPPGYISLRERIEFNNERSLWHRLSFEMRVHICSFLNSDDLKACRSVCSGFCPGIKNLIENAQAKEEINKIYFYYWPSRAPFLSDYHYSFMCGGVGDLLYLFREYREELAPMKICKHIPGNTSCKISKVTQKNKPHKFSKIRR